MILLNKSLYKLDNHRIGEISSIYMWLPLGIMHKTCNVYINVENFINNVDKIATMCYKLQKPLLCQGLTELMEKKYGKVNKRQRCDRLS